MPVAPGMSILVEYSGVVRLHISTNITSLLVFHSKHFSQWESSLRLSHNKCSSNFHPLVVGQPFGATETGLLIFLQNKSWESWEFITYFSPSLTFECTQVRRGVSNFEI